MFLVGKCRWTVLLSYKKNASVVDCFTGRQGKVTLIPKQHDTKAYRGQLITRLSTTMRWSDSRLGRFTHVPNSHYTEWPQKGNILLLTRIESQMFRLSVMRYSCSYIFPCINRLYQGHSPMSKSLYKASWVLEAKKY